MDLESHIAIEMAFGAVLLVSLKGDEVLARLKKLRDDLMGVVMDPSCSALPAQALRLACAPDEDLEGMSIEEQLRLLQDLYDCRDAAVLIDADEEYDEGWSPAETVAEAAKGGYLPASLSGLKGSSVEAAEEAADDWAREQFLVKPVPDAKAPATADEDAAEDAAKRSQRPRRATSPSRPPAPAPTRKSARHAAAAQTAATPPPARFNQRSNLPAASPAEDSEPTPSQKMAGEIEGVRSSMTVRRTGAFTTHTHSGQLASPLIFPPHRCCRGVFSCPTLR